MENIEKWVNDLVEWLKDSVEDAGCKGIVLGLSGGIDSAVVAGLAKKAFPNDTLGIIMPCHSNPQDEIDGMLVAETLNLKTKRVDLEDTFDTLVRELEDDGENKLALSNIKPRLRMTTLYYYAQKNKYLVSGTGNKSEFTIGYFTKHGDSGVDLLPIVDFVKYEVKELAKYLGIPRDIITKAPSAGLWENQTDEHEMGFSYKDLDNYIETGEATQEIKEKIDKMNKNSEHKRKLPKMFKK
ncbi:NAD(+) synthase [Clostridium sp. D2Q-14]|uniref:NAD(+) synthase n=1 Tax=Anaeromonas gelatinilytica TaxID=2683194 RepID=UPI00193BDF89|nr:NAD(+) synthase [Anaeromonas gelatinilytica]MBS4534253.1 NAD(+) synthase [Anaeromonas gelatinilytica]